MHVTKYGTLGRFHRCSVGRRKPAEAGTPYTSTQEGDWGKLQCELVQRCTLPQRIGTSSILHIGRGEGKGCRASAAKPDTGSARMVRGDLVDSVS